MPPLAAPSSTLFLPELPADLTDALLERHFRGFVGFDSCRTRHDRNGKLVGFVEFGGTEDAVRCRDSMQGQQPFPGINWHIHFSNNQQKPSAQPAKRPREEPMPPVPRHEAQRPSYGAPMCVMPQRSGPVCCCCCLTSGHSPMPSLFTRREPPRSAMAPPPPVSYGGRDDRQYHAPSPHQQSPMHPTPPGYAPAPQYAMTPHHAGYVAPPPSDPMAMQVCAAAAATTSRPSARASISTTPLLHIMLPPALLPCR